MPVLELVRFSRVFPEDGVLMLVVFEEDMTDEDWKIRRTSSGAGDKVFECRVHVCLVR